MYAYCLFCQTQRCGVIAKLMEIRGVDRAFSPQIIRKQRKKGEIIEKRFDLLPGYVFAYSGERLTDSRVFYGIEGVVRRVGCRDDGYELEGPDLEFALNLLAKDGLIGPLKVCGIGDKVMLDDKLFNDCEGRVVEINYRKERAKVEFVFENARREIWVSLENVKRRYNSEGERENAVINSL